MKKRIALRMILLILIILNLWMIFGLSSESSAESSQTSLMVTRCLAQIAVRGFGQMSASAQEAVIEELHPTVRTLAHMTEFGSLGFLLTWLLLTYKRSSVGAAALAMGGVLLTATADELYQKLSNTGRVADILDVLLDCLGALIACSCLLLIYALHQKRKKRKDSPTMKLTSYRIPCKKLPKPIRIALVSDLHDNPYHHLLEMLKEESPDLILIPGDLTDDDHINAGGEAALEVLRSCAAIAPTYYSLGNHEIKCYHRGNPFRHPIPVPIPESYRKAVEHTGAVLLDNELTVRDGFTICGLTSGICGHENRPNEAMVEQLKGLEDDTVKLLLCHHPEYYVPYLQELPMDLVVCGHAHGGHWRIFGRGIYSPGQGLLPRYTTGILNGNCVISRGLGDHTRIPRICNPRELVMITLGGEE